jgi:hypothetical protein
LCDNDVPMIDSFLAAITLLVGFIFGVLKRVLVFAFPAMSWSSDSRLSCSEDDLRRVVWS